MEKKLWKGKSSTELFQNHSMTSRREMNKSWVFNVACIQRWVKDTIEGGKQQGNMSNRRRGTACPRNANEQAVKKRNEERKARGSESLESK